jgi:hypothetical protein
MLPDEPIDRLLQVIEPGLPLAKREELRQQLVDAINYLLVHDFSRLVQVLYRVDVSEAKLKQLLQEQPHADAAVLITDLLIQRQEEKIKTRQAFQSEDDIPEDEKW